MNKWYSPRSYTLNERKWLQNKPARMTTLDVLDSFLSIHLSPYKLPVSFSLIVFMADFLPSMDIFFTSLIKEEHQNSHTPLLQKKKRRSISHSQTPSPKSSAMRKPIYGIIVDVYYKQIPFGILLYTYLLFKYSIHQ